MQTYIVGLDIGSAHIKAVVGEARKDGSCAVVGVYKLPSIGIRKGAIDDMVDATQSLSPLVGALKRDFRNAHDEIYLGVGASDVKVQSSVGIVAVSRADYEIYADDVNRAVLSARAVNLPPNRMVLDAIVQEYIVDGVRGIKDPIELVGNRLEVNSLIIDVFAPAVKSMLKCVEMLGGGVRAMILTPLASAMAVLSRSQKDLGVVLVDIGLGKTSMCVYEEGKLLHTSIFPVGSGNITNDLAIGLKIPVSDAETVKVSFGCAVSDAVSAREKLDLATISGTAQGHVLKKFIANIIEMRLAEIFEFVNNELKFIGKAGKLPAGVVLVGGGIKLPGTVELAKREFKLPVQIGMPQPSVALSHDGKLTEQVEDPEFVCALGLLKHGHESLSEPRGILFAGGVIKRFFRYFAP